MTTNTTSVSDCKSFDYVVVGGGTAGCVIASRLAEYLPEKRTLLIEAGPSDYRNDQVLLLKEWLTLLGGKYDYAYRTTEQKMGRPDTNLFGETRPKNPLPSPDTRHQIQLTLHRKLPHHSF